MMSFFRRIRSSRGQGMMEYMIISALVGVICLTAVKGFGEVLNIRINQMSKKEP